MAKAKTDSRLEEALAILINNQASFLSQMAKAEERFFRIERKLADIEAILLRHEQILQSLPEAVRQKVGFSPS